MSGHHGVTPGILRNSAASLVTSLMVTSRSLVSRSMGMDRNRPRVYGCSGSSKSSKTLAYSTTRPAYITQTTSAFSATTPRLWVMSMMPMSRVRCSSRRSSRICAWMVTSSAVVGSSASSTFGRHASAIAIITRWRMPPENWCGYMSSRSSGFLMPTSFIACTAMRRASSGPTCWCRKMASISWSPMV